jgi:hypothetical protein
LVSTCLQETSNVNIPIDVSNCLFICLPTVLCMICGVFKHLI